MTYASMSELLELMEPPYREACAQILADNEALFQRAPGSSHNHQAWSGGYYDHIHDLMNLAVVQYSTLSALRPLAFSLSQALVVLFLHDLEKPWAYYVDEQGVRQRRPDMVAKDDQQAFRLAKLAEVGVTLDEDLASAIRHVEGEIGTYSNKRRAMSPLAAFCHCCDVIGARLWHDYPRVEGDEWEGAPRCFGLQK